MCVTPLKRYLLETYFNNRAIREARSTQRKCADPNPNAPLASAKALNRSSSDAEKAGTCVLNAFRSIQCKSRTQGILGVQISRIGALARRCRDTHFSSSA